MALRAIEVAGYSSHHTCYLLDLDGRRVLFSSDAVFYAGALLLLNLPGCRLEDYRRDSAKLRSAAVDVLLPGHGIFVMRYGHEHINRAIEALAAIAIPPNFAVMCPKVIPQAYR